MSTKRRRNLFAQEHYNTVHVITVLQSMIATCDRVSETPSINYKMRQRKRRKTRRSRSLLQKYQANRGIVSSSTVN